MITYLKLNQAFHAGMNFPEREPRVRAYLHRERLNEVYGEDPVSNARDYLLGILDTEEITDITTGAGIRLNEFDFILAVLRGNNNYDKIIDFCALGNLNGYAWPGNPDIHMWVVRNKVYVPDAVSIKRTTGHGLIAFAKEEEFRRTCEDMNAYAGSWPDLGELGPAKKMVF